MSRSQERGTASAMLGAAPEAGARENRERGYQGRQGGDAEVTPGLRAIRQREAEVGLDRWPRVCMRRDVPDSGS